MNDDVFRQIIIDCTKVKIPGTRDAWTWDHRKAFRGTSFWDEQGTWIKYWATPAMISQKDMEIIKENLGVVHYDKVKRDWQNMLVFNW